MSLDSTNLDNNILDETMQTHFQSGQILHKCKVFEQNQEFWFLQQTDVKKYWYDIVMVKTDVPKDYIIKIDDIISVEIVVINIANDGTPGLFVKPVINKNE